MSKATIRTKEQILDASVSLFSIRGFGSTSIREIAEIAEVNPALISYHFKNKQGILESIMVQYFEQLFGELQQLLMDYSNRDYFTQLNEAANLVLTFQCEYSLVTKIILRELSVDSMLIREIMSTYITKLKSFFAAILDKATESQEFRSDLDLDMQLIHIVGGIFFPYFNPQLIREVFYEEPTSDHFRVRYMNYLSKAWTSMLKK